MNDLDGPLVAKIVYEELMKETLNTDAVPYALDAAVGKLKAMKLPPARWAPFIHIGA